MAQRTNRTDPVSSGRFRYRSPLVYDPLACGSGQHRTISIVVCRVPTLSESSAAMGLSRSQVRERNPSERVSASSGQES
jgi:hypothetical protein